MVVVVGTAAVAQVVLEDSEVQGSYDRVHMPVMGPLVILHVFLQVGVYVLVSLGD